MFMVFEGLWGLRGLEGLTVFEGVSDFNVINVSLRNVNVFRVSEHVFAHLKACFDC